MEGKRCYFIFLWTEAIVWALVKALAETSGVWVHQGSTLSPLLFVVVMQEVTKDWESLYADNLSERSRLSGGLKVNMDKTKMMVAGSKPAVRPQRGGYPYEVPRSGVRGQSELSLVPGMFRTQMWTEQEITMGMQLVSGVPWQCLKRYVTWWSRGSCQGKDSQCKEEVEGVGELAGKSEHTLGQLG